MKSVPNFTPENVHFVMIRDQNPPMFDCEKRNVPRYLLLRCNNLQRSIKIVFRSGEFGTLHTITSQYGVGCHFGRETSQLSVDDKNYTKAS